MDVGSGSRTMPLPPPLTHDGQRMTLPRLLSATALPPLFLLLLVGATQVTPPAEPPTAEPSAPTAETLVPDAGGADAGVAEAEASGDAGVLLGLEPPTPVPSREKDPPMGHLRSLSAKQDVLSRVKKDGKGHWVVPGEHGDVPLTIDPVLQSQIHGILTQYQVPHAAVVVLEPSTGRVLAMTEHTQAQPDFRGLATRAVFPAASIFKLVTGSALLEAGLTPQAETCFHGGGKRRISARELEDSASDNQCHSLADAMGKSANVIFAKLTQRYLSPEALKRAAARFHFNREIAFPVPMDVSLAAVPEGDEFRFAQTGAGFGDVYLSPLHGALLAAVAANGGVWKDPVLFEPAADAPPPVGEQVLSPEVARDLTKMMEATVANGTARRVFHERGMGVPGAVGKTGTLADNKPFRDYSWFVGFAPKDHPRLAVAAVIVNEPLWRIRAAWLGREALRLGMARLPKEVAPPATPASKEEPAVAKEEPAVAPEGTPAQQDDEEAPEQMPVAAEGAPASVPPTEPAAPPAPATAQDTKSALSQP